MTREEAIEILQGAIKKPNTKDGYLGQAIDMAIKALEQEPKTERIEYGTDGNSYKLTISNGKELEQEPCDDAISRKAVLEIFGYVMDYWKEHAIDVEPHEIEDALIEQYEFTAKQLSDLPPVNPQNTDVLDEIRAEIERYQADCNLSCSDDANCRTCDRITFDSIYHIIDKYRERDKE